MGIKFLCPNGHKLHVKSFLSGKKAICPKCAARVVVPGDSIDGDSSVAILGSDAEASQIAMTSGLPHSAPSERLAPITASVASADSELLPASGRSAGTEPTPAVSDPLDEAPSAVWYVRPATGGQFGPASVEIMRAWIGEGRVGASSLVWRAGWPEWRAAAAIFPQLGTLLASPGVSTGPPQRLGMSATASTINGANGVPSSLARGLPTGQVVQSVAGEIPSSGSSAASATIPPLAPGLRKKNRNKDVSLIASAILLVISIILVVILILIWSSQGSSGPTTGEESETAPDITVRDCSSFARRLA
jgi:hypothetical protein